MARKRSVRDEPGAGRGDGRRVPVHADDLGTGREQGLGVPATAERGIDNPLSRTGFKSCTTSSRRTVWWTNAKGTGA